MSNLHVLLVADGRSPITRNWIAMLKQNDYFVSLVSTFPYEPIPGLKHQKTIPVGFSFMAGGQVAAKAGHNRNLRKKLIAIFRPVLMRMRAELTPRLMRRSRAELQALIENLRPDVVHALRIPFEGMLCTNLPAEIPLAVSVWGNDLTLHAHSSHPMHLDTQRTLERADGLLADASRDIMLAQKSGLQKEIPTLVVPGGGGLDLSVLDQSRSHTTLIMERFQIPDGIPLVINPRGFRPGSVHQDTFFKSIPLVLEKSPEVLFVCPGMQGQPVAENWIRKLGLSKTVKLLPYLDQEELWALYGAAEIYISLSSHDGTPNSFLEACACGCYPIVGDIASLRAWITPGENGSLVNPGDEQAAAFEICGVIANENLRIYAAKKNRRIIEKRADREVVRKQVADFYQRMI